MKEFDKPSTGISKLGPRKARSVRKGIHRGKLRVHRARKPLKNSDQRGFFYQGRTRGKHLKSTRSRLYKGA